MSNFQSIVDVLTSPTGDATPIHVVDQTDSICSPCPHRIGSACTTEEKITVLDHAHATALAIQPGDTISWGQAKERIKEKITLEVFHRICATCSWKEYGICEGFLKDF